MATKETVRLRPPRERDDFTGDPTGATPAWKDVRATVVPRESQDYEQRGPVIISGFLVRLAKGTPVDDTWELEIRGELHQVDGAVADYGRKGKILYTMRAN